MQVLVLLESLVEYADSFNAVLGFLLRLELEAHLHFLEVLPLVRELVRNARILVVVVEYLVVARRSLALWLFFLQFFEVALVVLTKLGNTEVEGYYL